MDESVNYYDAVSDVMGYFSSEFRNYVQHEKLLCHYKRSSAVCVFDSHFCLFRKDEQANDVNDSDLTNELISIFQSFPPSYANCLVQFWKAEELSVDDFGESRFLLTTRNQPFLITGYSFLPSHYKGICSYRMNMVDIVIGDRGGGGVIGRVYRSKRIEFTPNIGYYSSEENPLRDLAASCGINYSIAIPIYDSFGHLVGVLEAVLKSLPWLKYYMKYVIFNLQRWSNLRYPDLDHCKDLCGQCDLEAKSLHNAVSEIKKVMQVIGKSCGLLCAQTWMLCNHCGSLSISGCLHHKLDASYESDWTTPSPVVYTCNVQLKKGEGVVGKAATSSHNLVYCEDVSQLSITEYPLAHIARDFKLNASFAICLRSYLTGSQIYILEFFLDRDRVNGIGLTASLVPILEAMRQNFQTFKVASGEEIGDKLSVLQVVDSRFPHKFQTAIIGELNSVGNHILAVDLNHNGEHVVDTIEERGVALAPLDQQHNNSKISGDKPGEGLAINISLLDAVSTNGLAIDSGENMANNNDEHDVVIPRLEQHHNYVQNDERVNVVGTSQEPFLQGNVIHTEENIVGTSEECIINSSKLPQPRGGFDKQNLESGHCFVKKRGGRYKISSEELMEVSRFERKEAAKKLGVSVSTFRRVCREYKIERWPPRQRNIDDLSRFGNSSQTVPAATDATEPHIKVYPDKPQTPVANAEVVSQPMAPTRKRNIDHLSSFDDSAQTASTTEIGGSAPSVLNESFVIKAKYEDIVIKFHLSTSSGIDAFNQQVSKRLKLDVANYRVTYQDDDNDRVLVACDEDLKVYFSSSLSLGKTTLIMSIERI